MYVCDMKLPELKTHPEGLWEACDIMEMSVANELRSQLSAFEQPISRVPSSTLAACKKVSNTRLPFDISTDSLAKDYGVLKAQT